MAYQKKSDRGSHDDYSTKRRPAIDPNDLIDFNDVEVLKHYVTDYGKIIPVSRILLGAEKDSIRYNETIELLNLGFF